MERSQDDDTTLERKHGKKIQSCESTLSNARTVETSIEKKKKKKRINNTL